MHFKLLLLLIATFSLNSIRAKDCTKLKSNTKLFCFYGDIKETGNLCHCTHVVLPEGTESQIVDKIRKQNADVKILLTVSEFNEKLVSLLKGTQVDGVELNLRKIDSKNDLMDFISTVKSKLGSGHYIAVSVPSKTESLAKNFDFKELSKHADVFILNTAFLGASQNVTFHPSRLSGLWDMQNTDSMIDLVSGLGAPLSKIVISAPVQGFSFTLQSEEYTAPGSPATELKSITRKELCDLMQTPGVEWTLERDQDQAGPYIFRGKQWIAFEDETSIDIKTKYARVRNLAGIALKDLSQDTETKCGSSILTAAFKGLSKQARAPRGAVLHTLEREILSPSTPHSASVHDSPFRISRIIDTEGKIHVVRQDTRTEFECSRQGYFVHPRSCNRFYRCVKFDQRTEDYNVFEFDCPAGLTFDEKTEVCVWPGSLPHASACSGSSEIAPVPQKRFTCPTEPGYYADPENCRWFFACLDHGEPTMQAYEFRCPFGLVFDEEKLLCEWPWLVPKCGLRTSVTLNYFGGVSNNINQYDGLGVLQTVKLGGLHGPIQPAEAKTYSNVGFVGLTDKTLTDGRLFSENSARFIDASRRLGLSLRATQSLYDAGLLSEKLQAIGLSQSDFGLKDLASEVNSGLHQDLIGLSLKQEGSDIGVSSKSGLGSTLGTNNGEYIEQYNGDASKYTQGLGNSASFNIYQQNNFGVYTEGNKQSQEAYISNSGSNAFANLDQSSQGHLTSQTDGHLQLNLGQLAANNRYSNTIHTEGGQLNQEYSSLGGKSYAYNNLGQLSSQLEKDNVRLVQQKFVSSNIENQFNQRELQNKQKVNNFGAESYSQSYNNFGQSNSQQSNLDRGLKQDVELGQGQLTIQNTIANQAKSEYNPEANGYSQSYINLGQISQGQNYGYNLGQQIKDSNRVEGSVQYLQGLDRNLDSIRQSYVNAVQNQGQSSSEYNDAQQLNLDHSGVYEVSSGGYSSNIEGTSQVNQKLNKNLVASGQSSSYFNLAQPSGSKIDIQQSGVQRERDQTYLNLKQDTVQLEKDQSSLIEEAQRQINNGVNGYRQNGGLLLQNVEINGAAGTYTDDIAQSNLNIALDSGDIRHVTPFSVSPTTATSFESIVSATPLGSIDDNKQKQSIDLSGIEYSINNLEESKYSGKFENTNKQATSYQFVQNEQPSFISSTPSSIVLQQDAQKQSNDYSSKSSSFKYDSQLKFTAAPQVQYATSTSTPVVLQENSRITYSQQNPSVSFSSVGEQGIISGQSYSQDGGYSYDKPSVVFEETPVSANPSYGADKGATSYSHTVKSSEQRQQVYLQQPQVVIASTPASSSSSSYFRQDSSKTTYQAPKIQQPQISFGQKVSTYNTESDIAGKLQSTIIEQPRIISKQPTVVTTSFNYIHQNQPQISVQPSVKSADHEQQIVLTKQEAVSTRYDQVRPSVQSQIIYEQPEISAKRPDIVVESYNVNPTLRTETLQEAKSYSYSQQNSREGYKYEVPQVSLQQQPQLPETTFQNPSITTTYNVKTGYNYERPSVVVQEEPKVNRPVIQENFVQSVIQKQPVKQQEVTSYQYFQPIVQQPRGFTKTSFQEEAVKTYSYSNPVRTQYVMKQASIIPTNYKVPVIKNEQLEFQGYGYPRPQVPFVEEPEAVVTNYENKVLVVEAPIVPKKAYVLGNSFQYERRVPTIQFNKEQTVYSTPKPTFISTINSVISQKANVQPQKEFIYYDSRLDKTRQNQFFQLPVQNVEIEGYRYSKPTINFEEVSRQSQQKGNQYYESNQVIRQRPVQVVSYTTPRPTYQSTIQSYVSQKNGPLEGQFVATPPARIHYLESTTLKPLSTVTTSYISSQTPEERIPNVEINGYINQKSQSHSYQYSQQTNAARQKQVVVEQYDRPVYYSTERPSEATVVSQKVAPVNREYFYHDSRLTSTQGPDARYVETSTRAPIVQSTERIEFDGYDYPKPSISFGESETGYINRKSQSHSYQYSQQTNAARQKQVVVEQYDRPVYYSTERPSEAPVVSQKVAPVNREYFYYDSRLTSTQTPEARYVETSTKAPIVQSTERIEFDGYDYPKPSISFGESETGFENKIAAVPKITYGTGQSFEYKETENTEQQSAKAITLENYVSSNYQDHSSNSQVQNIVYTTPRPTYVSTLAAATVDELSPNLKFTYSDNRYSSTPRTRLVSQKSKSSSRGYNYPKPDVQLQEEPQQVISAVDTNKEAQPIILENYVSPNYKKYDVSIQSSTPESILSQEGRQEILRYDGRSQNEFVRVTQAPVQFNVEVQSGANVQQNQPIEPYYYHDSRFDSKKTSDIEVVSQTAEVYQQEGISYGVKYSTTGRPAVEIRSRPSVTIIENEQIAQRVTTEEPSSTYLPIRKRIRVTKPSRKYLPTSSTPSSTYLPSSTPSSTEYVAVLSTEAPSEGSISVENYENFELVRKKNRPVKVVKIVRPRVKNVVVKKNDFNPFLSAKLGAQCTCTSNTIELRREPLRIEVSDEYEDDEGILVEKQNGEGIIVENYESGNVNSATSEPEYTVSSTVETPSSTYRLRKVNRGRIGTENVVVKGTSSRKTSRVNIEASDVNIITSRVRVKTPRIDIVADDDTEVNVETSRSRSNQLEVKSGENVEINSRNFDRYGPGGLRSTSETLQGIDCQRAGLFRHPTQCNKFYSCKWDCKKNKFTLHIFNCPVHLTFDNNLGACNWPSQGPACLENTLLPSE